MTDKRQDETKTTHQEKSFKEQILEQMRQASRQREELLAQEERARKEAAEALKRAEEARLEAERQAQLAEEEARRQAALEAELAELAREEEERKAAERQALYEAQKAEEARQEAARREASHQAYLAQEDAKEQARQAEKQRLAEAIIQAREASQPVFVEETSFDEVDVDETFDLDGDEDLDLVVEDADVPLDEGDEKVNWKQAPIFKKSLFFDENEEVLDEEADLAEEPVSERPILTKKAAKPAQKPVQKKVAAKAKKVKPVETKKTTTNRLAKKISLFVASLLLFLILATSVFGYFYVSNALKPIDPDSTEYVQVEIPSGSGNKLIGKILAENGVIKDATVFNYYTKFKNYTGFGSGYYNFQKNMSLETIISMLKEGGTEDPITPPLGRVLVPEGYTIKQIAKAVALNSATSDKTDKSPFKEEDFLAVVQDEEFIARMVETYPNLLSSLPDASTVKYQLEGYLFPATYDYYDKTTVEELVEQMIASMDKQLSTYYSKIAARNMTVNEILSMASLIEKEGQTDEDRPQIASVFYNRMAIGMPLQSNIAILYALDKLGDKTTLAEDAGIDTTIDSPYNIYTQTGLTPGPVDSPSLSAIEAAVAPSQTNYLYFVADVTTGIVYYAETFDEHNDNVEKYVNNHLN